MRRVVVGRRNNNDYGLFISQPGEDAYTESDLNLAFSTEVTHGLTMHAKGLIGPFTTGSLTMSATFPALSYVPQAMLAFYDSSTGYYYFTQREVRVAGNPTTGTYNVRTTTGPRAVITPNSISITADASFAGLYGHYVILRAPGGG